MGFVVEVIVGVVLFLRVCILRGGGWLFSCMVMVVLVMTVINVMAVDSSVAV